MTALGLGLLLALGDTNPSVWTHLSGLFLMGVGVRIMLTASVNLVQSAWPESIQGDISGVSRSVSNLGSSLGVAIAGFLGAGAIPGGGQYLRARDRRWLCDRRLGRGFTHAPQRIAEEGHLNLTGQRNRAASATVGYLGMPSTL